MSTLFVVIEIILAIAIVGVVLLQKSSSLGLGVYSGSNESLFGARGPAGFLAKLTMFLGFLFLANTIYLGYQFNTQQQKSIFDNIESKDSTSTLNQPLNQNLSPLNAPLQSNQLNLQSESQQNSLQPENSLQPINPRQPE